MQDNEYEYAEYEAQNDREDEALRRRERDDETNPVTAAVHGWLASQATEESVIEMERRAR
jgi:hypothetical protein